jgi:hypothetical protein
MQSQLQEIVVEALEGVRPEEVALEWVRRLELADGVRVAVVGSGSQTRPRRFVVHQGRVVSPQQHAAAVVAGDLEAVLRAEGRPMDAWEILQAARRQNSALATATMATISLAARQLVREGRASRGRVHNTWATPRRDAAVA